MNMILLKKTRIDKFNNITIVKTYGRLVLLLFCILELIFYYSLENLVGCVLFLYAWWLLSRFVLSYRNLNFFLLPTVAVLGYIVCYYFLPLIMTFVEGKPVTYCFSLPYETFFNMFLNVTVIVVAYRICINHYQQRNWLSRIWRRWGYYTPLKERQIWFLGLLGLFFLFLSMLNQSNDLGVEEMQNHAETGDFIVNFLKSYSAFPLCLLFAFLMGNKETTKTKLLVYIIILSLIGIATTRRALIFKPIANLAIIYVVVVLIQNKRIFTKRNLVLVVASAYLITGPFAEMATAMILNRSEIMGGVKRLKIL